METLLNGLAGSGVIGVVLGWALWQLQLITKDLSKRLTENDKYDRERNELLHATITENTKVNAVMGERLAENKEVLLEVKNVIQKCSRRDIRE